MTEYLTQSELAERWGIGPDEIDALEARGVVTDAEIVGESRYMLVEILAVEKCGLHLGLIAASGHPIDGKRAPVILGSSDGTLVEFGV